MGLYWVYFDLPNNQTETRLSDGEMRLSIKAENKNAATAIAMTKASNMNKEWAHQKTVYMG